MSDKPRILFVAEAVTLAHVARADSLARTLDPAEYRRHLAWDPRHNRLLGELPFPFRAIRSIPSAVFLQRLSRGAPMHRTAELRGYVEEDLHLIREIKPSAIIGDFRLSLAASARVAKVPLVAVGNAYWSPYGGQAFHFPEYDYPLQSVLGQRWSQALFDVLGPIGFAAHTKPLNTVLRERGLPGIGGDIRRMYTEGDYTAYADIPALVPGDALPSSHTCIGAVVWSPSGISVPPWWDAIPKGRPVVYVTLGSSGEASALPAVLTGLADLPVTVIASTAGRIGLGNVPANALVADFLPGAAAAATAGLVICNGGSPTTYQALAAGVPVLGLTSNNMDQHLNMEAIRRAGAGEVLKARTASPGAIRAAALRLLETPHYAESAKRLQRSHQSGDVRTRFPALVERASGAGRML